jgi:hypothetical protein
MMEMWTEPGFTKRGYGRMGVMGSIATWFGVAFAIIGVIGDVANTTLGLSSMSWFMIAIVSLIFSLGCWLGWAVGIYLITKEKEGKK